MLLEQLCQSLFPVVARSGETSANGQDNHAEKTSVILPLCSLEWFLELLRWDLQSVAQEDGVLADAEVGVPQVIGQACFDLSDPCQAVLVPEGFGIGEHLDQVLDHLARDPLPATRVIGVE